MNQELSSSKASRNYFPEILSRFFIFPEQSKSCRDLIYFSSSSLYIAVCKNALSTKLSNRFVHTRPYNHNNPIFQQAFDDYGAMKFSLLLKKSNSSKNQHTQNTPDGPVFSYIHNHEKTLLT